MTHKTRKQTMKKEYMSPQIDNCEMDSELPLAASLLDSTQNNQSITVSHEETDVFTSRRNDMWTDDMTDGDF